MYLEALAGPERDPPDADVVLQKPVPERALADAQLLGHAREAQLVIELGQKAFQRTSITLLYLTHKSGLLTGQMDLRKTDSVYGRPRENVKRFGTHFKNSLKYLF